MDSKATTSLFDYVSNNDLTVFNGSEHFTKSDKLKEEENVLEALRKIRNFS
jgi:hypothetical protein